MAIREMTEKERLELFGSGIVIFGAKRPTPSEKKSAEPESPSKESKGMDDREVMKTLQDRIDQTPLQQGAFDKIK